MIVCRNLSRLDLGSILHQIVNSSRNSIKTRIHNNLTGQNLLYLQQRPISFNSITSKSYQPLLQFPKRFNHDFANSCVSHQLCFNGIRLKHTAILSELNDDSLLQSKYNPSRYIPPKPVQGQIYQTLTFYTITPINEEHLGGLRDEIFLQLAKLDVTGRIYLAKDGINVHLCVPVEHVADLQSSLENLVLNRYGKGKDGAIWNFSCETPGERVFSKLKVAVKRQLVADGRLGTWDVNNSEPPQYLEPEEFHARLDQVGDKVLLVDMRNHFENEVGTFKTAVKMDCTTFRENMDLLDKLLEGKDRNEEVMMVCTGGIRCSISGRYLKQKGFQDVKMLKGGITSYGRYIKSNPDAKSHFLGKNFTFDGRRGERITEDVISSCHQCSTPNDSITNCANISCHLLFIQCPSCRQKWKNTCGPQCHHAIETGKGPAVAKPYDYHGQVRPGQLLC